MSFVVEIAAGSVDPDQLSQVNITCFSYISGQFSSDAAKGFVEKGARIWLDATSTADATAFLNSGVQRVVVPSSNLRSDVSAWSEFPDSRVVASLSLSAHSNESLLQELIVLQPVVSAYLFSLPPDCWNQDPQTASTASSSESLPFHNTVAASLAAVASHFQSASVEQFVRAPCTSLSNVMHLAHTGMVPLVSFTGAFFNAQPAALGSLLAAFCVSDRADGLIATVVVDEQGVALGLVYSNAESIAEAVKLCKGVYWSRKRGLWQKGLTSGAGQDLLRIDLDCDSDCLRFVVHQHGEGFCHLQRRACWPDTDTGVPALYRMLEGRKLSAPPGSYTAKLLSNPEFLAAKILEEAKELIEAKDADESAWEMADLLYFASAACVSAGVSLADVERHLDVRALKIVRRPGLAKAAAAEAARVLFAAKEQQSEKDAM